MSIPHHILGNLAWLAENPDDPTAPQVAAYVSDELREWVERPEGYVPREVLLLTLRDVLMQVGGFLHAGDDGRELIDRAGKIMRERPPAWFVAADLHQMTEAEYDAYARWVLAAPIMLSVDANGRYRPDRFGRLYMTVGTSGEVRAAPLRRSDYPPEHSGSRLRQVPVVLSNPNGPRFVEGPVPNHEAREFVARCAEMIGAVGFCEVNGHRFERERHVIGRLFSELPCVRCGRLMAACYDACVESTADRQESP